jgi:hypothetical protein
MAGVGILKTPDIVVSKGNMISGCLLEDISLPLRALALPSHGLIEQQRKQKTEDDCLMTVTNVELYLRPNHQICGRYIWSTCFRPLGIRAWEIWLPAAIRPLPANPSTEAAHTGCVRLVTHFVDKQVVFSAVVHVVYFFIVFRGNIWIQKSFLCGIQPLVFRF